MKWRGVGGLLDADDISSTVDTIGTKGMCSSSVSNNGVNAFLKSNDI